MQLYTLHVYIDDTSYTKQGPGGSMSQVVGLPNNSYKPITNTAWVRSRLCKLQKRCTRLAAASDKAGAQLTMSFNRGRGSGGCLNPPVGYRGKAPLGGLGGKALISDFEQFRVYLGPVLLQNSHKNMSQLYTIVHS